MNSLPVLIVGGGIVGLTLAQALQKAQIPYQIFERDASAAHATEGWGLTIHWALRAFESCLPPETFNRLRDVQVDVQQGDNDTGRFLFLDLATAEPKYVIPPSKRTRVHRRKLRALLADGLPVHWNKQIHSYTQTSGSILAHFEDGTMAEGCLLVGADGSSSRVRRLLFAGTEQAQLNQLPARFVGVTVRLTPSKAKVLRDIDPLLFQGSHPETGVYLWYSTLSTPETNGSIADDVEYYEGQLMMSWLHRSEADDVPESNRERVMKMKIMAQNFEDRLRNAVWDIPDDIVVQEIRLQDWPPQEWNNIDGRVTLVGDAAHAMTMYRGEAFNHGITDAAKLSEGIVEALKDGFDPDRLEAAVETYESEMRERTHPAVLLSRQACLDAHDINNLGPDSPLVSRRSKSQEPGIKTSPSSSTDAEMKDAGTSTLFNNKFSYLDNNPIRHYHHWPKK
ncbi:FAD-binding domain-containing protein [Lophiotrema nucula]|uniref:FAD-binding domain-containing protein n=1 Tax=Lophiotrema nucula TaxID=690887 RepID=A0A6A5ZQS8_9PLEO|nr:FAD-binding domain-containing protein [Lophiotrema nucula]